jgi:hypothetical protein
MLYNIRNQDIFKIMKDNKGLFDLSNYPKDSDSINNKVIGKLKNESIKPIKEFVGLRAKLYTFTVDFEIKNHNKAKGINKMLQKIN